MNSFKLHTSCILNVPFENYGKDFTFIVNGKEFKTSMIISDLISPYLSKIHSSDPTFDRFIINTDQKGDFSNVLKLINFNTNNYPESELPFLLEVFEILDNDCIESKELQQMREITIDTVFSRIQLHEKYSKFYSQIFLKEIAFISSNFSVICEEKEEELKKLSLDTLYKILTNEELHLKSENQLIQFINKLYITDIKYSILYETVLFENVSSEVLCEFVRIYDNELMTCNTWQRIANRLVKQNKIDGLKTNRYIGSHFDKEKEYDGIINYLKKQSNGQIKDKINITSSSIHNDYVSRLDIYNATLFEDYEKHSHTKSEPNSWICFDFKEHRIMPTDYSIRSYPCDANYCHPRSWVIECSNDKIEWEIVDEVKNCPYLNGKNFSHTFTMKEQKLTEFKYVRMRITGPDWGNQNYLAFSSFEIYGYFI